MESTDNQKVVPLKDEDHEARRAQVAQLVKDHDRALRRYLRAQLAVEADRDDLIQEIYFRVVRHMDISKFEDNTRAYLFKTATNLLRDRARRRAVRRSDTEREVNDLDVISTVTPEQHAQSRQSLSLVHDVLMGLAPNCRKAFLLSRFSNKNYAEIGQELGVSASMVEKHVAKALAAIRQRLIAVQQEIQF